MKLWQLKTVISLVNFLTAIFQHICWRLNYIAVMMPKLQIWLVHWCILVTSEGNTEWIYLIVLCNVFMYLHPESVCSTSLQLCKTLYLWKFNATKR